MQAQIVHEAEIHRQHVRLRIPIAIEIDGARYAVDDWSVGGFGVAGPPPARQTGERFTARLIFPFEDFELSLRLDAQMVYALPDESRFGGRFLSLSQGQAALFRYLVDAYLSGELVSGPDILAVAARDAAGEARVRQLFEGLDSERTRGRRLRRILGTGLLVLAGLGLAGLVGAGAYERYAVVTTDRAVIEAPLFPLKATATGRVEAMGQGLLKPGDPAARLVGPGETAVLLASPCECVVDSWVVPPGQVAQAGEVVATLVAADQPLTARAEVSLAQARRLRVGQPAEVAVPGEDQPFPGRIERIDFRLKGARPGEPPRLDDPERRTVPVTIRPDRPFEFDDLGYAVSVRFR
jgi:alginate biosynthesis protein Alg44